MKRGEYEPLEALKKDDRIVIKKADKGGGIVILNKSDYIAEANKQLNDNTTYLKLSEDPTKPLQRLITTMLEEAVLDGTISPPLRRS